VAHSFSLRQRVVRCSYVVLYCKKPRKTEISDQNIRFPSQDGWSDIVYVRVRGFHGTYASPMTMQCSKPRWLRYITLGQYIIVTVIVPLVFFYPRGNSTGHHGRPFFAYYLHVYHIYTCLFVNYCIARVHRRAMRASNTRSRCESSSPNEGCFSCSESSQK
jgi:hypothetical protein